MAKRWVYFQDENYYSLWAVRTIGENRWGHCFHVHTKEEAEGLCSLLNETVTATQRTFPVMKFKSKQAVIEAAQYGPSTCAQICEWMGVTHNPEEPCGIGRLQIPTLSGEITAYPGDWIIKDSTGQFYPCRPDVFKAVYDQVEEAT